MSVQPPDAVAHLRGLPESRPLPGLNDAVRCSSRVRRLTFIFMLQAVLQHTCYNGQCMGTSLSHHST